MKQETKLKSCPFCGSTPAVSGYPHVVIECTKCRQARVEARWYAGDLGAMEVAWNRRAPCPDEPKSAS